MKSKLKIVAISDTHRQLEGLKLPKGDVLVHAGDLTHRGHLAEVEEELDLLQELGKGFKAVLFIPGNHDGLFQLNPDLARSLCQERGIDLLIDESLTIDGIKFHGSPVTPVFKNWYFTKMRGKELELHWLRTIPDDVDVLITHGPPAGVLDSAPSDPLGTGCEALRHVIFESQPQFDLKLHIFGHLHQCGGQTKKLHGITFYNAAILNDYYEPHGFKIKALTVEKKSG